MSEVKKISGTAYRVEKVGVFKRIKRRLRWFFKKISKKVK